MISVDQLEIEARAFLATHLRPADRNSQRWGEGNDRVSFFPDDTENVAIAKTWQATKFDAGFGWISGPSEHGGRGLSVEHDRRYRVVERDFQVPDTSSIAAHRLIGPTVEQFAAPATASEILRPLYRGDIVSCQLFSEPGAGSDLAAVSTAAQRDGDDWVLTGQKVWSSSAHIADLGLAVCRTDRSTKHAGITVFLVDMHAPGVEVRPLRQMTGSAHFNEVFLDEVRVPDVHRLGDINGGWRVAMATLLHERMDAGDDWYGGTSIRLANPAWLAEMMRATGNNRDPLLRDAWARLYTEVRITKLCIARLLAQVAPGQAPGPEMSITKLRIARDMDAVARLAARVLGAKIQADSGEWGTYAWAELFLGAPSNHIGGGTDEIMKNILGERVLGLPRDA